jgi:dienelactone hydrolase
VKSGANPDNIVVIYCFGGTGVLEAARGHLNVKGSVSFHGGLGRDKTRPNEPIITAKIIW